MSKFIYILLTFIVVSLGALLIVPSFIDWSQYKDKILMQVESATGYKLSIDGEFDAAFLPAPHVTFNQVGIDSAGAKGAYAFKGNVETASVSVALIPLFSGEIVVTDVTLISPIFDVKEQIDNQTADQALNNAETDNSKGSSLPVQIESFYTKNAKVNYKPLGGAAIAIELPEMKFSADDIKGPFEFDGQVKFNEFDIRVKGSTNESFSKYKPLPVKLNIDGGAYKLDFSGIADLSGDLAEIQGEILLNVASIKNLVEQFGSKNLKIKEQSLEVKGLVSANSQVVKINDGQLKLGNAEKPMPLKLSYNIDAKSGLLKLQDIPGKGIVDLDIAQKTGAMHLGGQIDIQSLQTVLSDVLGVVEKDVFNNPQFPKSVTGDINLTTGDTIKLSSRELNLDAYKLRGTNLSYKGGDAPKINLSIDNFDGATVKLAGTLDDRQGVDVNVSHPNAVKFIQIFKKDFESQPNLTKPFIFSGQVFKANDVIDVKNMVTKLGDIDANGSFSLDNSASIPSIKADLIFSNLDTQALITGKKSSQPRGGIATTSAPQSSPWSRDAINTDFLRSMNIDLKAKANQLVHGTWIITNPEIDMDLSSGVLSINKIDGGLFGGTIELSGSVSAKTAEQPIDLNSKINIQNVDLSKFVQAALSQNKERVTGTGNLNLDLKSSGISSSALIYGLNADGKLSTSGLVIKGIDLAKVTEAISDESLTDLGAVVQGAFRDGQTPFEAVDYPVTIREGTMPVNNFTLRSPTADLISNGEISFSRWEMNLKNTIKFTNPDDLPSVDMTIKGPLNAPQQNVASDVLRSFIINKYGAKIQNKVGEVLGDKLKDSPAAGIINNLLGLPQPQTKQVEPVPETTQESQAETQEQIAPKQPSVEEQLIKGLFGK